MPMHAVEALEPSAEVNQIDETKKFCDAVVNTAKRATEAAERCADVVDGLLATE